MQQGPESLNHYQQANGNHHGRTDIRQLAGEFTKAFEPLGCMAHGERGDRTNRDKCECQADTERQHQRKSQSEFLELKTNQQHRKSRRTRQQPARQSEQD